MRRPANAVAVALDGVFANAGFDPTWTDGNVIDQIVTDAVIYLEIPVLEKSTLLDSASDER